MSSQYIARREPSRALFREAPAATVLRVEPTASLASNDTGFEVGVSEGDRWRTLGSGKSAGAAWRAAAQNIRQAGTG